MMKIQNSDFYTLLPESYKNIKNQCISYAVSKSIEWLCNKAQNVAVMAVIDTLSESVLDYLAVELRAPYYDQEMSRSEKAKIVASSLPWYMIAGTKAALEKLLQRVYGGSIVTEWFEYNGQPYHFKVRVNGTNNEFNDQDFTANLLSAINNGKNARSVLDSFDLLCEIESSKHNAPFIGCAIHQNILKSGSGSTITIVLGADSFNIETENTIDGGTFKEFSGDILDGGLF